MIIALQMNALKKALELSLISDVSWFCAILKWLMFV